MANTISDATPIIVSKFLASLRKNAVATRLINRNFDPSPAEKGEAIYVPIPGALTTTDVTPGAVPPTPGDSAITKVSITLDKWKRVLFHLTEKEAVQIANSADYRNAQFDEAQSSLANQINTDVLALYQKVYGYVGTAGTTPFATTTTAATDARKVLQKQLAPPEGRSFLVDPDAEANALSLAAFQYVQNAGNDDVMQEGRIGRRLGFDFYSSTLVPTHTAGTGTGYLVNNGAGVAAGATSAIVDTGSGTIVVGDIVTFNGDSQTYTVTSALASNTFSFSPAKVTASADNTAITVKASHVVNLAFARDAFTLATRPVLSTGATSMPGGTVTTLVADPISGLNLRMDVIPGYHQTTFEVSMLYGVACLRPEFACRIAG